MSHACANTKEAMTNMETLEAPHAVTPELSVEMKGKKVFSIRVLWGRTLIEEIADYIKGRLETNEDFVLDLGCIVVASAAGPGFYIMTEKGKLYLNLSTICVGGSGISDKSLALRIIRKVLKAFSGKLGKPILLPGRFTKEAMTKLLCERSESGGIPEGTILNDEYTSMIKDAGSKDYMVSSLEFMSQLYSGYIDEALTIARGLESAPEVCVNFASVTTYYLITLLRGGSSSRATASESSSWLTLSGNTGNRRGRI